MLRLEVTETGATVEGSMFAVELVLGGITGERGRERRAEPLGECGQMVTKWYLVSTNADGAFVDSG